MIYCDNIKCDRCRKMFNGDLVCDLEDAVIRTGGKTVHPNRVVCIQFSLNSSGKVLEKHPKRKKNGLFPGQREPEIIDGEM